MPVEQEPLGGGGEGPAGIGRAPLHPDVLHVVGKQLLTPKVLKLPGLLHVLVSQEVLNLIQKMSIKFWTNNLTARISLADLLL